MCQLFKKNGKFAGKSGNRLKEQRSQFNSLKVPPLWNFRGHTGNCIAEFSKEWNVFKDAMTFQNHFEPKRLGKDWQERKSRTPKLHAWVPREEDCNGVGPIAKHLKRTGDLKSDKDLIDEESRKTKMLVVDLANQTKAKNQFLHELTCKYNDTNLSLNTMVWQLEQLFVAYNEEIKKMEKLARAI